MNIGDRVKITSPQYDHHEVGDLGTIKRIWWVEDDVTMFGVFLDDRVNPDEDGWSYDNTELELLK